MDSWDTANLVLGCFCIVLSFLPTGYLISNNRYKRKLLLAPGDRDHILSGVFNQFLSALTEPVE